MDITKQLELAREYLPEGYVIVPIEPTEDMKLAGICAYSKATVGDSTTGCIYKAMINEAQK